MISIKVNNKFLKLHPRTVIRFILVNHIFTTSDVGGSYTIPFNIPINPHNRRILGFQDIIEIDEAFKKRYACEVFIGGLLFFSGTLTVKSSKTDDTYRCSMNTNELALSDVLKLGKLTELTLGGTRTIASTGSQSILHQIATTTGTYLDYDYVFYPVLSPNFYDQNDPPFSYSDYQNYYRFGSFYIGYSGLAHPKTAMPYMRYVFHRLFGENSWSISGSGFFDDAEINALTIVNNYDMGNTPFNVNLQNHVPDITGSDFINGIRSLFGLAYFFNTRDQELEIVPLKDFLTGAKTTDWSKRASPVYELSQNPYDGFTLQYSHDPADPVGTGIRSIDLLNILGSVGRPLALPAASGLQVEDAYLVRSTNSYYSVVLDGTGAKVWRGFSHNLFDLEIDNGNELIEINNSKARLGDHIDVFSKQTPFTRQWLTPVMKGLGTSNRHGVGENPFGLNLAFYRGLQPDLDSYDNSFQYPLGTYHNYNFLGTRIGNYSLAYDGADGTKEQWWGPWLDFLARTKPATTTIHLDELELTAFTFNSIYKIGNYRGIIRQLDVSIDMHGINPATALIYTL